MPARKPPSKAYKPTSKKTRKPTKRPSKKGGKAPHVPQEDPIIVGGGSFVVDFDRTFTVGNHPLPAHAAKRFRGKHNNQTNKITQIVFLTKVDGTETRRMSLNANETAVAICYTDCDNCP